MEEEAGERILREAQYEVLRRNHGIIAELGKLSHEAKESMERRFGQDLSQQISDLNTSRGKLYITRFDNFFIEYTIIVKIIKITKSKNTKEEGVLCYL